MKSNNNILTIMKKEFARFFGDRRTLIMLIMPGILIYVVYSFMGSALENNFTTSDDYEPVAYVVNLPASMQGVSDALRLSTQPIGHDGVEDAKYRISQKEADLCLVFPADFDVQVASYESQSGSAAPNIEIYYNAADVDSSSTYGRVIAALGEYESLLANKFDVNRDIMDADQATKEDTSATLLSGMLPVLLLIFLFSGCMGIAPESIAGEKERGTIATLLVTPLKRGQLAIGKIISLGALALIGGLSSLIGLMLSLPKMFGAASDSITVNIYSATEYVFLALIVISTMLLFVTLISMISAFSKSVKEATTAVTPLMIVVMLVGVTGFFGSGAKTDLIYYIIPVYNSVQSMTGIFSLDYSTANVIVAGVSNLVYACIGAFALTKMFNSERVMFSK